MTHHVGRGRPWCVGSRFFREWVEISKFPQKNQKKLRGFWKIGNFGEITIFEPKLPTFGKIHGKHKVFSEKFVVFLCVGVQILSGGVGCGRGRPMSPLKPCGLTFQKFELPTLFAQTRIRPYTVRNWACLETTWISSIPIPLYLRKSVVKTFEWQIGFWSSLKSYCHALCLRSSMWM